MARCAVTSPDYASDLHRYETHSYSRLFSVGLAQLTPPTVRSGRRELKRTSKII
jgi:hypothetical protein